MIRAAVIGSTGYAGSALVKLLNNHPKVKKVYAASHSYSGQLYSDIYPNFRSRFDDECLSSDISSLAKKSDVIFLSLPHSISSFQVTKEILDKCVVIDLGADYRLKDVETYKSWYNSEHGSANLIDSAVYGLSELYRKDIASSRLIANPGCYTTTAILTAHPLLNDNLIETSPIIIDAKSGVSGAGRSEKLDLLYCEVNESIKPYGVATHRHTPEIEQELSLSYTKGKSTKEINVTFTPHLIPMNRGILCSVYGTLKEKVGEKEIRESYEKHYGSETFIRLLKKGEYPQTRWVTNSNFCDISFAIDQRSNQVIAFGALDNLIKGASGQAVQNMNIVFGFEEELGLTDVASFPT